MNNSPTQYLQLALTLAQERRGFCAPNPSVGVVIVKNEQIIATGYHRGAGEPHAEAEAFKQLSAEEATGSTVYVTLEPCCHQGRTPPCTQLLIQHNVKAVYYGFTDPNPLVLGQGKQQLLQAGIECVHLPLPEINDFYQSYQYWTQTKLPFVTAKLALSLDGKIAGPKGERVAITGAAAQIFTHRYRKQSDAILTTVKTVIQDDPQLNVRLPDAAPQCKAVYVLDRNLSFPPHAQLHNSAKKITLFHQEAVQEQQRALLQAQGIRCVPIRTQNGKMDAAAVLTHIGQDGVHDLLLEAGGICFETFLLEKKIQRAFIYVAPKWLGPEAQTAFSQKTPIFDQMKVLKWRILGEDVVGEFSP